MTDTDVVVVGAGPSGLATATTLVSAGLDVRVLEARDRVGGRTWSRPLGGTTIDVGGQWVGPTQHHLLGLIEELGLSTSPTPVDGRSMLVLADRTLTYKGTIPRLRLLQLIELQRQLWSFDRLGRRVDPLVAGTEAEQKLDQISLAEWMDERRISPEVRALVETAMRIVFGHEANAIPVLRLAQYVKAAGGVMPLVDTKDGAQDARVVGGMQQVSQALADRLGNGLVLSAPVDQVEVLDDQVNVRSAAGSFTARRVVMAIPPNLSATIDWQPSLSPERSAWLASHEMGNTLKTHLLYEEAFWSDEGLSGEVVFPNGPLDVVFDNTNPGGPPALVVFATGDRGRALGALREEQRREVIVDAVASALGDKARHVTDYFSHDWDTEEWSGGCPVATPSVGSGPAGFDPTGSDGLIHWAGTETATVWRGYIDGAIAAGRRAAGQVVSHLSGDDGVSQ